MNSDPRTAILNAAGEIFARYGFKKASVEEIARRAGVGKGTIYLYFENKEALFEAIIRLSNARSVAELEAAVHQAATPEGKVRAFIQCKFEQNARVGREHRLLLEPLFELGVQATPLLPEMLKKEAAVLERVLTEAVAQGAMAIQDPHQVSMGLMELMMGLTVKLLTQAPDASLKAAVDTFFEVFICGLAAPHPR
jgi:AcrR family transcriptional regulator